MMAVSTPQRFFLYTLDRIYTMWATYTLYALRTGNSHGPRGEPEDGTDRVGTASR